MFPFRPRFDVFRFACLASPASLRSRGDCWSGDAAAKHVKVRVFAGLVACLSKRVVPACWGGLPPYALLGPRAGVLFPPAEIGLEATIRKNSIAVSLGFGERPAVRPGVLKSWSLIFASMLRRCSVVSPLQHLGGVAYASRFGGCCYNVLSDVGSTENEERRWRAARDCPRRPAKGFLEVVLCLKVYRKVRA